MTKRISQSNNVAVTVAEANSAAAKVVAAKVVVPADTDVAKADEAVVETPVAAVVAPVSMIAGAQDTTTGAAPADTTAATQDTTAPTTQSDSTGTATDDGSQDYTPYVVGGVLLAGGIAAVALSSDDDDDTASPTPTPTNTAPTFTSGATGTVAENAATSTVVYDANATDAQNNTITYTIGGTDAALFNIDSATGVVTLKASANFEATPTKTSYSFTVTASDNGTPAVTGTTQAVTVALTNVNEAPTFANATATATVNENSAITTPVFTAAATDVDAGSVLTYSLGGTDAALFSINASTGAVSLLAPADFETRPTYSFTVNASDGTASAATQTVTLNVNNLAEGPASVPVNLDTATGAVSGIGTGGAAQATAFTDSATVASNATINNFGADDTVSFTGTSAVSFSSLDNDLTIQFVAGGVLNDIVINNIVSSDAIITNEATAEAAVNAFLATTGTDYFRFA